MDLGGETGLNPDVQALLDCRDYISQPTSAGSSSQKGADERPHQTIANAVRTMLISAHLPPRYWEYVFYFFLRIHTILPHGTNTESPYYKATNKQPDLSRLRTFGCRIYALGTKKQLEKLTTDNIICGCFLGYGGSMKNFIYENLESHRICRATHATFGEAGLNSPLADLTPNSRALWNALSRSPGTSIGPTDEILTPPENFCVFAESSPFIITQVVTVPLKCTLDLLGLILEADPMSRRNIIVNVTEFSSASHVDWEHDLWSRTIIMVDFTPVFLLSDITRVMSNISPDTHVDVSLTVTEYPLDLLTQASPLPQIALDQLRAVHHLLHGWDLADPVLLATSSNASTMASGNVHTRRTCLKGPHRASWIDAEFAQMDKHHSYGMFGLPIPRSALPPSARVVRPIWQYSQKGNGTFKARKCMNGKQLTRMGLTFEHTYAVCMEQHCLHMFVALAAILGFLIEDGDVVNAYAHADAEGPAIFLITDEVFQSWYKDRLGIDLPRGTCVPLLKAIQGHPEAGNWWSKHFDASCAAPLRLVPAFTEPTMYRHDDALCSGPTLVLRQVDDTLCGAATATDRDAVMDGITSKVSFVRSKALTTLFYATDLEQCAQYIRIYTSSYIGSCLTKLGWEATASDSPMMSPLTPAVLKT
jgi:hypothetical protein